MIAGRFEPGAKLTLRSVARALGVSLTPAREALYGLVAAHHKGAFRALMELNWQFHSAICAAAGCRCRCG